MKIDKNIKSAENTIDLQILALRKLKKSIRKSFNQAVKIIGECQSKCILIGVGKSGHLASLIASSLSSVGASSFALQAGDCVHGDLGSLSRKDVLLLISNSGNTEELKPIISYANRNNINLIGITSKKNSILYKASNIKILIPEVKEAGEGNIIPSSSLIAQTSIGSALVIAVMRYKKHGIKIFRKYHPAGTLSKKLLTVEDLMVPSPFVSENCLMKTALKLISKKKLGLLVAKNNKGITKGLIVDGDIKRASQRYNNLKDLKVKNIMTKNPVSVEKEMLAVQALSIMNTKKITSLCVHNKKNIKKTIGVLHIHNIIKHIS